MRVPAALLAAIMIAAPPVAVGAHSWYSADCCSGKDCRPVPARDVRENPDGSWTYLPAGVVFAPHMVRESEDDGIHICMSTYGNEDGSIGHTPHCIYLPRVKGV